MLLLLLTGACRQLFGLESPTHAAADAANDGVIPDAGLCTKASTQCLGTVLRTCSGAGVMAVDTMCAWGCVGANGPHCAQLVPAGGGVEPTDLQPDAMLMAIALTASTGVLINTDTGAIGTVMATESIRAAGTGVISGIGYSINNGVAVFRFASLTVSADVAPVGNHAIALVADGAIDVSRVISLQATCVGNAGTLGGSPGGAASTSATGSGGGTGAPAPTDGGGGGGYGGTGGLGAGNIAGGSRYGQPTIGVLVGGGGGGGGGGTAGGNGGGAIQLASNTRISISGGINAGGCGGKSASGSISGAGGGGAGGTIVLEAPQISIPGKLAVNGGGGGGVGTATNGTNGTLDRTPAAGGTGNGNGGVGAAASMLDGATATGLEGGGGGGGIGRIRMNTRTGSADVLTGSVLSPELDDPGTTCTQGAAVVQ